MKVFKSQVRAESRKYPECYRFTAPLETICGELMAVQAQKKTKNGTWNILEIKLYPSAQRVSVFLPLNLELPPLKPHGNAPTGNDGDFIAIRNDDQTLFMYTLAVAENSDDIKAMMTKAQEAEAKKKESSNVPF